MGYVTPQIALLTLGLIVSFDLQRWQKWISEDGKRSDAAHNYLYNKKRENVTVITGHLVKRVIFEWVLRAFIMAVDKIRLTIYIEIRRPLVLSMSPTLVSRPTFRL